MIKPLRYQRPTFSHCTFLLLVLCAMICTSARATALAEQRSVESKNLSLDVKDEQLGAVMEQIEKLSGYVFIYSNDEIDASTKVTLQVKNEKLESTLEKLFGPLSIAFKVMKNKIILTVEKTSHVQPRRNSAYLVSGLVKDERGDALPGVTVMIKGTSSGTSTDASGRYAISVADTIDAVLTFSFIGYKTVDIPVNGQTTIDVSLEPSIESLAEVVVVGYATQK
jgi:hypothetical protein